MSGDRGDDGAAELREGLLATPRRLPAWLFYDDAGSALFDRITRLPEYYLTRVERLLLERHADELAQRTVTGTTIHVIELGAGTADKTRLLLAAFARRAKVTYVPVDVSSAALDVARDRIQRELPDVGFLPIEGRFDDAWPRVHALQGARVSLFLGSSIGNFEDRDAISLLASLRAALAPGDALVLGADRRKDPATMCAAYDDAAGVTAAFNLNALGHLNRRFEADFQVDGFRHLALWNDTASRIEMHLECTRAQSVTVRRLGLTFEVAAGERLHTESCAKYDDARVAGILAAAGFSMDRTFVDDEHRFGLHLALSSG